MFDPTKLQGIGMDQLEDSSGLPLLKMLQPRCAEVDEDHRDYEKKGIRGAKNGDIAFTPESKILPRPVSIVPLAFKSLYAEWKPKGQGGGLVQHHPLTIVSDSAYAKGRNPDKPYAESLGANDLVMTMYVCVLFADGDEWKKGILALTSTNLKHGRTMQAQIKKFTYEDPTIKPFVFSRSFKLDTQKVSDAQNSWYEFKITPDAVLDFTTDAELLENAYAAHQDATLSLPTVPVGGSTKQLTDEDVPF